MSAVSTTEAWPLTAPPLLAVDLRGGRYATMGEAADRETMAAERPFRVEVVPAALLAGLPSQNR